MKCARDNRADIDGGLFDFFEEVLTLKATGTLESEFCLRFQQFTSPVMAKGVEDTAFYCFNRLTSMCEVGGNPARDGLTLEAFHAYQAKMQATHPQTMTTLSTHDTKRSDDVRARLAVLSEVPEEFAAALARWGAMNAGYKTADKPDRNSEYFLYQTLIGAWPIDSDRTKAYMQKAMREAKLETSWVANNKEYEDALNGFIDSTLEDKKFVGDLKAFVARVLDAGRINSLTQTLLKCVSPGVPDLYQGGELWDLSLVDPDNRRPVDYGLRTKLLQELQGMTSDAIVARMDEGLPKLHLIHAALKLRRERPECFGPEGRYEALPASGDKAQHVVAFQRGEDVIAVAVRESLGVADGWGATRLALPASERVGVWRNVLTNEEHASGGIEIAALLEDFPVALLAFEETRHA